MCSAAAIGDSVITETDDDPSPEELGDILEEIENALSRRPSTTRCTSAPRAGRAARARSICP